MLTQKIPFIISLSFLTFSIYYGYSLIKMNLFLWGRVGGEGWEGGLCFACFSFVRWNFSLVARYFLLVTFCSLLVNFCSLLVTFCSCLLLFPRWSLLLVSACCLLLFPCYSTRNFEGFLFWIKVSKKVTILISTKSLIFEKLEN